MDTDTGRCQIFENFVTLSFQLTFLYFSINFNNIFFIIHIV